MKNKFLGLFIFLSCFLLPQENFAYNIESHEPYDVGEVGALWEFPSDHLSRGLTINNFHLSFWNILNKNYLGHIEENTQGLRESAILRDDIPSTEEETLTVREMTVFKIIMEMINHPTHPRSIIALQETHEDMQKYLEAQLPENWRIIAPPDQPISQDLFLYNTDVFEFINADAIKYKEELPKTIFTLTLIEKSTHQLFRFLQSHVPGGPNSPEGCKKFSEEALKQYDPVMTIVLMGDMNQSPAVIEKALIKAAEDLEFPEKPYKYLPIDYPSHMNTHLQASWIDNFFVHTPENPESIQASHDPEELSQTLVPIMEAFRKKT